MKQSLWQATWAFGCGMWALMTVGCAGTGEVRYVDLHSKPPVAQPGDMDSVRIAIEPFEDRRPEKGRVGMRSHLWGGVTYYNVAGEQPGHVIAQALADRLKARGWHDRAWNVRVIPAGSATDADIVITGQVQQFSANAKSRVFSTAITTKSKLTIQARNLSDKSATTRSVEGAQSRTVFWFDEDDDLQELLAATLADAIDRLIADTTIEQRSLRPVQ
ncbi:MAG: hypothetical protein ICV75_06735 [Nitrospiraceae bacterium]|nr:hypothetical protein [Nitrospiraceae bacterium]